MVFFLQVKQYPLRHKAVAFLRGVSAFSPLVEVAKDGLTKGYSLDAKTETAYINRITGAYNIHGMARVLRMGCSEPAQDMIALRMARIFADMAEIHSMELIVNNIRDSRSRPYGTSNGIYAIDTSDIICARHSVIGPLVSGAVTSINAQLSLAQFFYHLPPFDKNGSHDSLGLPIHLKRLMACEAISTSVRFNLIKNLAEVVCPPCEEMLGIQRHQR